MTGGSNPQIDGTESSIERPDASDVLALLRDQRRIIDAQQERIDRLALSLEALTTRGVSTAAGATMTAPIEAPALDDAGQDTRTSRRRLLKLAGAGVVGAVATTAMRAQPAAAADGNPLNIGNTNSTSVSTNFYTVLDYSPSSSPALGLVVRENTVHRTGGAVTGQASNTHGMTTGVVGHLTGNNIGIGVTGQTDGPGSGVYGQSLAGFGVFGASSTGYDLYGGGNGRTGRAAHITAGPPTAGSYGTGDEIRDNSGNVFVCVIGGSPGTWRKVAGPSTAGALHVISGSRVLNNVTMANGQTQLVDCSSRAPVGATAVQVTILAFGTTADGYQTCYAEGTPNPGTINCFWSAGAQMATAAVVPVSAARRFSMTLTTAGGSVGAAVDIGGYYL